MKHFSISTLAYYKTNEYVKLMHNGSVIPDHLHTEELEQLYPARRGAASLTLLPKGPTLPWLLGGKACSARVLAAKQAPSSQTYRLLEFIRTGFFDKSFGS